MKIALVTTFNKRLYEYYAHRFVESYNWPFDLYVYHEGWHPPKEGIFFRDINKYNPELQEFIDRNSTKNVDSQYEKHKEATRDYKMDAIRFAYKIFAKTHLMLDCDYDYVFWADADIVFKKTISERDVIRKFLPEGNAISFIDRPSYYSECGFVGYNLKEPITKSFIYNLRKYYTDDLLFNEREWHDSYVWDCVRRKQFKKYPGVKTHNLAPTINKVGNPWPDTYMAEYCDHFKGKKRKDAGEMLI
tara:strand:- start:97 stop:834 length:738 start_codon:yes stop_codon:yes gene_type:complete